MMNFKIFIPYINYMYYPDNSSYDIMSFKHEVGECFFIPIDAKMKVLEE